MYRVEAAERVQKFLEKLDDHVKRRLEERLKRLKDDPTPSDSKFIGGDENGEKIFRYSIGDYRALYKIKQHVVLISKIDKRSNVYD